MLIAAKKQSDFLEDVLRQGIGATDDPEIKFALVQLASKVQLVAEVIDAMGEHCSQCAEEAEAALRSTCQCPDCQARRASDNRGNDGPIDSSNLN